MTRIVVPLVLEISVLCLSGCSDPHHYDARLPNPVADAIKPEPPPPALELTIDFEYRDGLVRIKNLDDFNWTNCQIDVNPKDGDPGFISNIGSIRSHKSIHMSAAQFADSNGRRFNPFTHKITKVMADCDIPAGHASAAFETVDQVRSE